MKYKSVIVTQRGEPEILQVIENDLRSPFPGEARIKILATPVCRPDVQARYGQTQMPIVGRLEQTFSTLGNRQNSTAHYAAISASGSGSSECPVGEQAGDWQHRFGSRGC